MKASLKKACYIVNLLIIFLPIFSFSQNNKDNSKSTEGGEEGYKTSIGLRGGSESGLTIKHFIKDNAALEGIFSTSYSNRGFRVTGLYEIHKPFPDAKGLDYFYGFGAHVGFNSYNSYGYYGYNGSGYYDKNGNWHTGSYKNNYTSIGIDAILGLEYQFTEFPFTAGLDVKPYFDFINGSGSYFDVALSLRYVFR